MLNRRQQKLAAFLCAVPSAFGLFLCSVSLLSSPYSGPSPACVGIERDVMAYLRVGDSEARVVEFFAARKWPHPSAQSFGQYDKQIFIDRSWLGEEHLVIISVQVRLGVVTEIRVRDFNRFL